MTEAEKPQCGRFVSWWSGEYEGNCELPKDHEPSGQHYDGLSWFDDEGEQIYEPTAAASARLMSEGDQTT